MLFIRRRRLHAWIAHAHGIERVVAEHVEGSAIFAPEEDVVRALRHVDTAQQLPRRRVNKDLAGGEIDIAFRILGQAFSALLDERCDLR